MERGWKSNVETSPACPRCGSSNTKFCYYNNYSLTQPRYFCKGCRRYWTKGGSLRNVPVGGGCRKSRRGNNKTFRDDAATTGIPLIGGVAGGGAVVPLSHLNGTTTNPLILSESSTSSMNGCTLARAREKGTSSIDLALVYANFLNQKPAGCAGAHDFDLDQNQEAAGEPRDRHRLEIPILMPPTNIAAGASSPFPQFSSVDSIQMMDLMTNNQSSQESDGPFAECGSFSDRSSDNHFSAGDAFYFPGLDSIDRRQSATDYQLMSSSTTASVALNRINNYLLPPLPGEELSTAHSGGTVWSGCCDQELLFPSHKLHGNQSSSGIQAVQDRPDDQLDANRSPFNVSIELCNIFRP